MLFWLIFSHFIPKILTVYGILDIVSISWYASRGSASKIVECGDFIKNKKRIKTKQCAPGWARISEKSTPSGVFFCNEPQENVLGQQKQVTNYQSPPGSRSPIIPQNMK